MPMLFAPNHPAASNVRVSSASTTARWNDAQRSAISGSLNGRPSRACTSRSTAVLRPLKLKSARCSSAFSNPGGRTPAGPGVRSLCVILKRGRS